MLLGGPEVKGGGWGRQGGESQANKYVYIRVQCKVTHQLPDALFIDFQPNLLLFREK